MADEQSKMVELLKYPALVFSILVALIIAKYALGITFGPVTEVSKDGVKFGQAEKGELAAIASRLNGAIAEIEELRRHLPAARSSSPQAQSTVFEAAQTVSDQTAQIASISSNPSNTSVQQGYIWIGNYKDRWTPAKLGIPGTGQAVTVAPSQLAPGTEYQVLGNMVVRDGLPNNDATYFEGRKSLGTIPRGTKIRLVEQPMAIDRQFATQYWVKVELP